MTKDNGILTRAREGLPLEDTLIIDGHGHIGYWPGFHIPHNDAQGMIETMDGLGINKVCISAHAGIGPDYKLGNDMVIKATQDFPDRFIGYITINPNYPDDLEKELKRCVGKMGLGEIHPMQHEYPANGPRYRAVWEYADQYNLPVLIHTWGGVESCKPSLFEEIAREYPRAILILGHAGGNFDGFDDAIKVAKKRDNVYLDLTGSELLAFGLVEYFVKRVAVDRILYGSDIPFMSAGAQLGKVVYAKISDENKQKILGLNMARLLKIAG